MATTSFDLKVEDTPANFLLYVYTEPLPEIINESSPPFIMKQPRKELIPFLIKNGQKITLPQPHSHDVVPSYPKGITKKYSYTFK
jgi:hypothetical protein